MIPEFLSYYQQNTVIISIINCTQGNGQNETVSILRVYVNGKCWH